MPTLLINLYISGVEVAYLKKKRVAEQTSSSNSLILSWTKGKPLCDQVASVSN